MARLVGPKFEIVYKKGKENVAADALSRVAHLMALQALSEVQPTWVQEVLNSYTTDSHAQTLLVQLAIHSPNAAGYILEGGFIRYQGKLWVGQNSALQTKIISAFHPSPIGGHSGVYATYQRVKQHFTWKGLKQASSRWNLLCSSVRYAKKAKHVHTHPAGKLQPLPILAGAWQDLSMDFIDGLPNSDGYSVIMVVEDRLTILHIFCLSDILTLPG